MRTRLAPILAVLSIACALQLAGCASGGGTAGPGGGDTNLLTAEDLADVQQLDAAQAIQRLRPRWMRGRGNTTPSVIVDGTTRMGGVDALAGIRISDVEEMRFISASDATLRYGSGHTGGAIVITTRR